MMVVVMLLSAALTWPVCCPIVAYCMGSTKLGVVASDLAGIMPQVKSPLFAYTLLFAYN